MNILKERWQPVDKRLNQHIILYNNLNMNMQDEIQAIFDGIKISFLGINKPISNQQRSKLDRLYQQWQESGIMTTYFSLRAQKILRKKNITNLELISLMIEAVYLKRDSKLDDEQLLKDIAKETYLKEADKPKAIDGFILALLLTPNPNGYIWSDYKQATTEYYAKQMVNQVVINLQQQKELDITKPEFQKVLDIEQKRYLNKKKEQVIDKFSGALDTEVSFMVNSMVLRALDDMGYKQVRFVAVIDENTSKMCKSLDLQIFKINGKNRFSRYSQTEDAFIEYEVDGLISGLNLPPINDGFHYCRSTITGMK